MAYAEKLVKSWRACWYVPGKKTPDKLSGFASKKEAERYATEQEVEARRRGHARSDATQLLLKDWADEWFSALDLEPNTMRGYKSSLEQHIIPRWGEYRLRDLALADNEIATWRKQLLGDYAPGTVERIMGRLVTLLGDAVHQGIIHRNPASKKRRRGRMAPKRKQRQEGRYRDITDPLGAFLIAERVATLTGRDDEFVMMTAKYYLSLRWSELLGMERSSVTPSFHLTHQLNEVGGVAFYWKVPKDGSERVLDVPPFLLEMLTRQAQNVRHPKTNSAWCPCGDGLPQDEQQYRHKPGIHLFAGPDGLPHWPHRTFLGQFFYPAARGMYYDGQDQACPVFLEQPEDWWDESTPCPELDPFSRVPTGRGVRRPEAPAACWAPIARKMKPHGLRHSAQALLQQAGVHDVMVKDRMGHAEGTSASQTYSHVTPVMREQVLEVLQDAWGQALEGRHRMGVESSVGVVRELLEGYSRSTPDRKSRLSSAGRGMVA